MNAQQLIELSTNTWNDRDRDGYFATYHDDCEVTHPGSVGKGRQGLAEFWSIFMDAFPDNHVTLLNAIGGKLTSSHFYYDNLEFLTQLGVMTG